MDDSLRQAIESLHNCKAVYKETVAVNEAYDGETVWDGDVFVFELEGHPTAQNAYAWMESIPKGENVRMIAVLHEGPVKSAADAVRASIVKDFRGGLDD